MFFWLKVTGLNAPGLYKVALEICARSSMQLPSKGLSPAPICRLSLRQSKEKSPLFQARIKQRQSQCKNSCGPCHSSAYCLSYCDEGGKRQLLQLLVATATAVTAAPCNRILRIAYSFLVRSSDSVESRSEILPMLYIPYSRYGGMRRSKGLCETVWSAAVFIRFPVLCTVSLPCAPARM